MFILSGEWTVTLFINNHVVDNCKVDVCDPSQVKVSGLRAGMPGSQHKFHSKFLPTQAYNVVHNCKVNICDPSQVKDSGLRAGMPVSQYNS